MAAQNKGTIILDPFALPSPQDKYFTCTIDWNLAGYSDDGKQLIFNYTVTIKSSQAFELPFYFKTDLNQLSSFVDGTVIDTVHSGSAAYLYPGTTSVSFGSTFYVDAKGDSGSTNGIYANGVRFSFSVKGTSNYPYPLESFSFSQDIDDRNTIYEIPPKPSDIKTSICYIGLTNNLAITKYTTSKTHSRCTTTITCSFNGLEETIVANHDGTSYAWVVPEAYANMLGSSISMPATLTCLTYYDGVLTGTTSKTVTIAIPASTVTVSSAKIGQKPTFAISKKSEDCYSTLTYAFGDLTGTIVSNFSGTSYSSWTIPDSFYYEMKDTKTKYCTITCTTYKNSKQIGLTETSFVVSVDETKCTPTMNPTVVDNNSATKDLTGSEDSLVKYQSIALCNANVQTYYGASVTSCSITCSGKTISSVSGEIDAPTSGTFVFTITDSRGFTISKTVTKTFVEYFNPTCYLEAHATVDNTIDVEIHGRVYNGSFGAYRNNITVQYRYMSNEDNSYGGWIAANPSYDNYNYSCTATINGLEYRKTYTVQARIVDSLNTYESSEVRTRATPIFDWSNSDFNFNVPVNINGKLDTDGLSVIGDASVTRLSVYGGASFGGDVEFDQGVTFYGDLSAGSLDVDDNISAGGNITGGGDLTVSNTVKSSNLNVTSNAVFNDVQINGTLTVGTQDGEVDYVIENKTGVTTGTGTGSVWTWRVRKWNSGFCECWGESSSAAASSDGGNTTCYFPVVFEDYNYNAQFTTFSEYNAYIKPVCAMGYLRNSSSITVMFTPFSGEYDFVNMSIYTYAYISGKLS